MGAGGVTIHGEQSANWSRTTGRRVATAALPEYPNIELFGDGDEMAIGASIAPHHLHKDIFTLGSDGKPATLDQIKSGQVAGTLGVYPKQRGATTSTQMEKVLDGKTVTAHSRNARYRRHERQPRQLTLRQDVHGSEARHARGLAALGPVEPARTRP